MKALEPSRRAPSFPGPTTDLPCARSVGQTLDEWLFGSDDKEIGLEHRGGCLDARDAVGRDAGIAGSHRPRRHSWRWPTPARVLARPNQRPRNYSRGSNELLSTRTHTDHRDSDAGGLFQELHVALRRSGSCSYLVKDVMSLASRGGLVDGVTSCRTDW
jgi:hypothetical protein